MRMSTQGLMALIGHEGIVLSRYKDSVGVWTIGIGHTAAAGHPDPAKVEGEMTVSEVISLLRHDIRKYEDAVNRAVRVPLKQHEFDALVSFHYNTGAIGRASFVKLLNKGDRTGAMKRIMDWKKPKEIIPRRTAERDLFRTGRYPAPYAMIYPATSSGAVQWGKGRRVYLPDLLAAPPAPAKPVPAPIHAPKPEPAPAPSMAGEKLSHSKRFWTWLSTGGGTAALPFVDWRTQMLIVIVVVGFAIYAIATMPAVRKKLGLA